MLAYNEPFIIRYALYEYKNTTLYVQVHSFIL